MPAKPESLKVSEYFGVSNQLSASAFSNSFYIGYMVSVGVSDKYIISFNRVDVDVFSQRVRADKGVY